MRPERVIGGLAVVAWLVLPFLATNPATADDFDGASTNVFVQPTTDEDGASVELVGVDAAGGSVTGPGAPAWLRACTWREWTRLEMSVYLAQFGAGSAPTGEDLRRSGADPDEAWGAVFCNVGPEAQGLNPSILLTGLLSTWPLSEGVPRIVLDYLIARAYASIELPVQVGDAAPMGDEQAPMITQLPTWLWIDPAVWQPVSATTPSVFGVTATVTATPARVVFEGGDEVVDCGPNLGPAYDFNRDEEDQHSDCTLTYRHSSAVGDWTLSSTIWWEVGYSCSAGCGTGQLPPFVIRNS
jgi:hypothetical protein